MRNPFLVIALVGTLFGCTRYANYDFETSGEAWLEAEEHVRGLQNVPFQGFMFLYSGPWAWSEPDWRITVDFRKGFLAKVRRYEFHPGFQAREIFESGVRTREELFEELSYEEWVTTASQCPGLKGQTDELWSMVTSRAADFSYNLDGNVRVMLDGGFSYDLWLSNGMMEKTGYSVVLKSDPIVQAIQAYEETVIECAREA